MIETEITSMVSSCLSFCIDLNLVNLFVGIEIEITSLHFLHESYLSPNQSDPTSGSSSTAREEGHRRDESRKPRAKFQEEQARVLAASLRARS
ncbi:unnamed protein product [Brassica rapa subsp. trilocularis]